MLSEMQHFTLVRNNRGFLLITEHYDVARNAQPDRLTEMELSEESAKKLLKHFQSWYSTGHMPELSVQIICGDVHIGGYVYDLNEFGESR